MVAHAYDNDSIQDVATQFFSATRALWVYLDMMPRGSKSLQHGREREQKMAFARLLYVGDPRRA